MGTTGQWVGGIAGGILGLAIGFFFGPLIGLTTVMGDLQGIGVNILGG
jgi:hypothetical protein